MVKRGGLEVSHRFLVLERDRAERQQRMEFKQLRSRF
jgi:hypothetical protein